MLIATSTMEVEFIVCYKASNYRIWLRNFITGLQILGGIVRPLKVYCDNKIVNFIPRTTIAHQSQTHRHKISGD